MGAFDDAMKNAVPGGNLATPIAVAVGALILGKMFGGSSAPAPAPGRVPPPPAPSLPANRPRAASWAVLPTSSASSPPAAPRRRSIPGSALGRTSPFSPDSSARRSGQTTLNELSQRTGMSQQELLNQLAAVLPQLINHLTPNGRMPTLADLEK